MRLLEIATAAAMLVACAPGVTAEPTYDDTTLTASWEVCWATAPGACEDAVFSYPCQGEVVSTPYTRCHGTRGGGLVSLLYSAEVAPNECDIEGRIEETWESLSMGLEQLGGGD